MHRSRQTRSHDTDQEFRQGEVSPAVSITLLYVHVKSPYPHHVAVSVTFWMERTRALRKWRGSALISSLVTILLETGILLTTWRKAVNIKQTLKSKGTHVGLSYVLLRDGMCTVI